MTWTGHQEEAVEEEEGTEAGRSEVPERDFIIMIKLRENKNFIYDNSPFISDEVDNIDALEGIQFNQLDFSEHLDGDAVNTTETADKVVDGLIGKVQVWAEYGAGKMNQNIVSNGLRLNFTGSIPGKYEEPNNKSFQSEEEFGISEIRKLLVNKVIEEVDRSKVICVNPLSVASNAKGKKRLCLDLSRHVNEHVQANKFRIESVMEFQKSVKEGSWCYYFDLKSAFHHVNIIDKHRKYLGLKVFLDGKERVFQFRAMPFGYRDASRILTKLLRTPLTRWRSQSCPVFIHIDDGLGFRETKEEAQEAASMVRKDLAVLGLKVSEDKSMWKPVQQFEWCGFFWDTARFRVEVTRSKRDRIKRMAQELLDKELVSAREMAAFTGLVISCAPAVGRSARFHTRASVGWSQALVDESNWGAEGRLSQRAREELTFWISRLDDFSSQLIRHSAITLDFYVCSDSGEYQVGGRVARSGKEDKMKRFQVPLEDWERQKSSTYRELRSVEYGLILIGPEARGMAVRYGNDNFACCKVVEFGSTKEDCHEVAKRINELVEKYQITLQMVWRRRNTEEIVLCDRISKEFDLSEYRIQEDSFNNLEQEFGPFHVDWFASHWSCRLDRFCSKYWTIGSEATDAFAQDWGVEEGFFHPPIDQLARVLEKAEKYGARGILVVPDWPGSEVDSLMREAAGKVELLGVRHLEMESPSWRQDDTFRGWTEFGMRVYRL